jgi:hypothetical protein
MSRSFARMATVPFTTKRVPPMADGKQLGPQPHLVDPALRCTPLDPADPGGKGERVKRLILEAPVQLLETFMDGALDIAEGDILVALGREHQVRAASRWEWRGETFRYLVLEDLQR